MKRFFLNLILTSAAILMLTGCGHEHDYQAVSCDEPLTCSICGKTTGDVVGHDFEPATCTEPKICSRCGEEEGKPKGHKFLEATCTEPATCKRCGETEGEPLGHDIVDANYQECGYCLRCGEEVGEPLTPGFIENGLDINCTLDREYDYITEVYEAEDIDTVGTAVFEDFMIFDKSDELPEEEGYVWLSIHVSVDYTDDNAWEYGYQTGTCVEDFYDIEGHDDSIFNYNDVPDEYEGFDRYTTYTVNYYGEDYDCERLVKNDENNGWVATKLAHYGFTYYFHVPEGYDGTVVGLYHKYKAKEWESGMYIYDMADDNTLFFRLDPELAESL